MADENAGTTATIEAPAEETISFSAETQPENTEAANSGGGDANSGKATGSPESDPYSSMLAAVEAGLNAQDDKAPQPETTAKVENKAETPSQAPTLASDIAQAINDSLGTDVGTKLVEAINKQFADLHAQIGNVQPKVAEAAQQVQSVAQRQAMEDAKREDAEINAIFDRMSDRRAVYGKGESLNKPARIAVFQEASNIAREIASSPAKHKAFMASLKGADPKEAVLAMADSRIYGKEVTTPEAIKQIRGTLERRSAGKSIPPGGQSVRPNETDDMYADARSIWANSRG